MNREIDDKGSAETTYNLDLIVHAADELRVQNLGMAQLVTLRNVVRRLAADADEEYESRNLELHRRIAQDTPAGGRR
jgi:hypothetical protein